MNMNNNTPDYVSGVPFGGQSNYGPQQAPKQVPQTKAIQKRAPMSLMITAAVVAIMGIGLAGTSYMWWQDRTKLVELSQNGVLGANSSSAEYNEMVSKIRKLVAIPEDEKVNIARIDNADTLKQQNPDFYKDVKQGHYLVVMPSSQRVLIYDKEQNRIVNFSSYSIKVEIVPEKDIDPAEKPLTIEIRATSFADQAKVAQLTDALKKTSPNYKVTVVKNSDKNPDFKGIQVVLLNRQRKPKMSQNIIAHVGSNNIIEKLPEGESSSNADVVLIVGRLN